MKQLIKNTLARTLGQGTGDAGLPSDASAQISSDQLPSVITNST